MAEAESVNTMFQNSFVKNGDGDYALKTQGGTGGLGTVIISQTGTNNATQSLIPIAARTSSLVANGKATTPAAGAALATTAALSTGTWDVEVTAFIGGTTASVDIDNIQITQNGTNLGVVVAPVIGATGATDLAKFKQRIQVGVSAAVIVKAVALATTGAIYAVTVACTKVL